MLDKLTVFAKRYGALIIVVFHVVGLVLLGGAWREDLVVLTPLNLLLLGLLYGLNSEKINQPMSYWAPALLGYIIEVIGTNSGYPFGTYTYSSILGPRLFATPLMLGLLWWVLIRSWFDISRYISPNLWIRSLITGLGMVAMDFFIEPVAIELNFWRWEEVEVPVENYVAWFILSVVFARITASGDVSNKLSKWVLPTLLIFFAALCWVYA